MQWISWFPVIRKLRKTQKNACNDPQSNLFGLNLYYYILSLKTLSCSKNYQCFFVASTASIN